MKKIEAGLKEDEKLLFHLLLQTGLRKVDAVDLRWSEVRNGFVIKTPRKTESRTGAVVKIPIQKKLQEALNAAEARRKPAENDHVLLNPNTKKPYSESRLWHHLKIIGKRVGVENVSPHRFRGSFVHTCYLKGINAITIAKWIGDTVKTLLKHYTFFSEELGDQATAKLLEEGK